MARMTVSCLCIHGSLVLDRTSRGEKQQVQGNILHCRIVQCGRNQFQFHCSRESGLCSDNDVCTQWSHFKFRCCVKVMFLADEPVSQRGAVCCSHVRKTGYEDSLWCLPFFTTTVQYIVVAVLRQSAGHPLAALVVDLLLSKRY